jgi:uncharacterized HAD superfamily protein
MKRLACDIDGVVADITILWCKLLSLDQDPEKANTWTYLPDKYGEDRFWAAYNTIWENLLPHVTDPSLFHFLKEMERLCIHVDYVSSRSKKLRQPTEHWLQIHGLHDQLIIVESSEEKVALEYDYYIDDRPDMVKLVKPPATLFLYNQPWNRELSPGNFMSNFTRVMSFDEVRKQIKQDMERQFLQQQKEE